MKMFRFNSEIVSRLSSTFADSSVSPLVRDEKVIFILPGFTSICYESQVIQCSLSPEGKIMKIHSKQ